MWRFLFPLLSALSFGLGPLLCLRARRKRRRGRKATVVAVAVVKPREARETKQQHFPRCCLTASSLASAAASVSSRMFVVVWAALRGKGGFFPRGKGGSPTLSSAVLCRRSYARFCARRPPPRDSPGSLSALALFLRGPERTPHRIIYRILSSFLPPHLLNLSCAKK